MCLLIFKKKQIKNMIFRTIRLVVLLYVSICVYLYFFQESIIFPQQDLNFYARDSYRQYEIDVDHYGINLHGWLYENKGVTNNNALIYYGGNAEEVSHLLLEVDRLSVRYILLLNYRGFGESKGDPGEQELISDALFVFDYLMDLKGIDAKNIYLLGRSLGSGIAVHVASKRLVGGVILVTPFDSLLNTAKEQYPFIPMDLLIRHRFESDVRAPQINIPALFVVGGRDSLISNEQSQKLAELWGGSVRYIVFDEANHTDISLDGRYWTVINDYLSDLKDK